MTVIDFNAAMAAAKRAGSFEPLPDGEYELVCLEATAVTSSNGNPMIKTKWQVETGAHAGSKVRDQFVFAADNDNSLSFFFQHMRHFGLDETFFAAIPSGSGLEPVATALPGRRCRMKLGSRVWDGRNRNEVLQIMPPASPNPTAAASALPGVAPAAVPGVPPATPVGVPAPGVPAPAPAAAPQVPVAPPVAPAPVSQPAAPSVAPPVPQVPATPSAAAPQPIPTAPAAPAAPAPAAATPPAPPQPVWDEATQQWVLPQASAPVPTTPEEPF